MAIDPLWLQNIDYPARIDRTAFDAIWTEGVIGAGDLAVTQSSPTAMSVSVAAGIGVVQGDDQLFQGKYLVRADVATSVAIAAAPGSGQRNDLIVLRVNDPNAGGAAGDNAQIVRIAGTASSTPVDPATPASALVLARVRVPAGTGAITNSLIDDLRLRANANYDSLPTGSVTSAKIADGAIMDADVNASAAITPTKLGTGTLPSTVTITKASFPNSYIPGEAVFTISGSMSVGARTVRYYCEQARTIANVVFSVGVAPQGASAIVDVNKNGTTIFTTQANRPTIGAGTFYDGSSVPDVTSVAAGDYLTIDVDQIGSTTAGTDAVVKIVFA